MWKAVITNEPVLDSGGTTSILFDVYKGNTVMFSSQTVSGLPEEIKEQVKTRLRSYKNAYQELENLHQGEEITL